MDLPTKLVIESIVDCCFIHFKDTKHSPTAPPHYYFVISSNRVSEVLYLISMVTSQFEKRLYYYQNTPNPHATQSLVRLEPGSFKFIVKESAVDCNTVEQLTKDDFLKRIDKDVGVNIKERNISTDFKQRIITAILNSPIVAPALKALL